MRVLAKPILTNLASCLCLCTAVNPPSLELLPSTSKLKKHIAHVCERLVKLAAAPPAPSKRALPQVPGARPSSAYKISAKPQLDGVVEEPED